MVISGLRLLLALVFIFSGFVKLVDPWGTAIKLGEYFQVFGFGWLGGTTYFFSIFQSGLEMLLGLALLFRLRERLAGLLVMLFMAFFTVLTFVIALWNPVSDCGCFGDAIKLTNWQTFYKNLILLPCAIAVWRYAVKHSDPRPVPAVREWWMLGACAFLSFGIGIYSLRYLPIIDFLPFRQGVHVPSAMKGGDAGTSEAVLIYRDRMTSQNREFTLQDTVWYDTMRWEFVDTRFVEKSKAMTPAILEFSVFDKEQNLTASLLSAEREYFVITVTDPALLSGVCSGRLAKVAEYAQANDYPVIAVTSALLAPDDRLKLSGGVSVPLYNIDALTLKTMIRTRAGLVVFKEGVILGKWTCHNLPRFEPGTNPVALSLLTERTAARRERGVVAILMVSLALAGAAWFGYRRR